MSKVLFEDYSEEFIEGFKKRRARALTECAIQLEGEIAILTPVDTGRLRNSISHIAPLSQSSKKSGDGRIDGVISENEAYVGTNVEYAIYQEYGTKYMKPQPFCRAGLANCKEKLKVIYEENMKI